jgi:hypothetical protein
MELSLWLSGYYLGALAIAKAIALGLGGCEIPSLGRED